VCRGVEVGEIVTTSKVLVLDKLMSAIEERVLILLGDEGPGRAEQRAWVVEVEVEGQQRKKIQSLQPSVDLLGATP